MSNGLKSLESGLSFSIWSVIAVQCVDMCRCVDFRLGLNGILLEIFSGVSLNRP